MNCITEDCPRKASRQRHCDPHLEDRNHALGRICTATTCERGTFQKGMCRKHSRASRATKARSDRRSPLRRGYEEGNTEEFFSGLIANCETGPTGCWLWQGQLNENGYPLARIRGNKKKFFLHRVAFEMSAGKPLGVLHAHHKCANRACVNPDHLQPATAAENMAEMLGRNSFLARIAELEAAIADLAPGHEVLTRAPTN